MAPQVAIAVPRRADNGWRDQLWKFVRDWWSGAFPEWKIVEGHHDDGPFNRSAAINRAAADAGDWDVLVVADADCVAAPDQLEAAVAHAAETGRLTFAFDRYVYCSEPNTRRILDGFSGSWEQKGQRERPEHLSSLLAVPRALWGQAQGFDDRFIGWGAEDDAFAAACRVLGGGCDRIEGTCWHLWHEPTPERTRTKFYGPGAKLAARYEQTVDPLAMWGLIRERQSDVVLIVTTDGRRDCIAQTIPAANERLHGLHIGRRVIVDDSGDRDYQAWLRHEFPYCELDYTPKRVGYTAAVKRARDIAIGSGQPWVFWLEDDFIIERDADLAAMADVLEAYPHLVQMALQRQAWYDPEVAAGGLLNGTPDLYTQQSDGAHRWVEHAKFWTQNPHLASRWFYATQPWPKTKYSETVYGRQVLTGENRSAFWGDRDDEPWATHIGHQRVGHSY